MRAWCQWSAFGLTAAALALTAAGSWAQPVTRSGVLTTPKGLTLYVFDNDVRDSGKSVCTGPCRNLHPPYLVEDGAKVAKPYGVVQREDGARQWSHKGRPLYLFYADEKPGDKLGDGVNRGTWHVATP